MAKTRINISIDQDLADFMKTFAAENRTTVADIVTQYALSLKRRSEGDPTEQILSNPVFREAMAETRQRLRDGTAEWSSYGSVAKNC